MNELRLLLPLLLLLSAATGVNSMWHVQQQELRNGGTILAAAFFLLVFCAFSTILIANRRNEPGLMSSHPGRFFIIGLIIKPSISIILRCH